MYELEITPQLLWETVRFFLDAFRGVQGPAVCAFGELTRLLKTEARRETLSTDASGLRGAIPSWVVQSQQRASQNLVLEEAMSKVQCCDSVSDQALLGKFTALVKQDRRVTADLLRYLDAIDRRQLWAKFGYSSLFVFCQKRFNMSEAVTGKRIGAMRTVRRFPLLLSMVESGEIHLSGIQRLSANLTCDNHQKVLAAAKHQSTRDSAGEWRIATSRAACDRFQKGASGRARRGLGPRVDVWTWALTAAGRSAQRGPSRCMNSR